MEPPAVPSTSRRFAHGSDETRGLWLGFVGVAVFALTTPMTRLAVGPAEAPQFTPAFVTAGRAAVAGLLALLWLWRRGALRRPPLEHARALALAAAGNIVVWPLCLAFAVREVQAVHAAVVTGVLPLATAAVAAFVLRQRASAGFWLCALLGCALVLGYAALQGGGRWVPADGWLLIAVLGAAVGYVYGARVSGSIAPEEVIGWVLVGALPLTLPAALWAAQPVDFAAVAPSAWFGFAYVSLASMWLGFFAWYRALALGGTLRVSQVQLLQPFITLLAAVPLLGETLDAATLGFALAVIATVFVGKRMPVAAKEPR
ncbi:MAG TPA: DMT family transporter [Methylibium sp.]|uniref:DMT family transporter n=1 Tax=Methylibium sp. TaxID=2067992 RepID=UPI002DB5CE95|nr:DMT family transporter [Methylibium sp.]HEU4458991.1 DMT family transporter [Methylibium sp.]